MSMTTVLTFLIKVITFLLLFVFNLVHLRTVEPIRLFSLIFVMVRIRFLGKKKLETLYGKWDKSEWNLLLFLFIFYRKMPVGLAMYTIVIL